MKKPITRIVSVDLTEDEFKLRASEIAKAHNDLNSKELERKKTADRFKGEIKDLEFTIQRLAHAIETRTEQRPVECFEELDVERRQVHLIRKDTGKIVESRSMTYDEMQQQLFERDGYLD
jgi:hypothetical protein